MRRRALLSISFLLILVAASACRSRKNVPAPQTVPAPVATATAPQPVPVPVPAPESEFVQPPAPRDVLSEDIAEANRTAHERGWIRDAFFSYDASTLDAAAQEALQQSATWLRQHPEFRLRIEGHCDERGTEQYNLALGDRRAHTALSYLVTLGVDRAQLDTVSYGEEHPFEEGSNEAAWSQNRRAHLVLSGRR